MRADAERNLDAVLETGARLLAADPGVSVAAIAQAAGVDRRTVYRRFPNRDALLCGIYQAKMQAIEDVMVALHRLLEGIVVADRRYPVGYRQMHCHPTTSDRLEKLREQIEAFLQRAVDEGEIRSGLPEGMAWSLFITIVDLVAHRLDELDPGPAADVAADTLLNGIGAR
jgi:AcrR family transcriptional regulator